MTVSRGAVTARVDAAPQQFLDEHRRVHDLDLVAELAVVVADRLHAVRARRQDLLRRRPPSGPRCSRWPAPGTCIRCRCAWPDRRCSAPSTARRTDALRAQDLEQRAQRLLEVGLERAGAAEPDEHVVLRRIEGLERRPTRTNFCALVVAEAPDVAAPLEVVVHRRRGSPARRRSTPGRGARRSRIGRCSMPTGH